MAGGIDNSCFGDRYFSLAAYIFGFQILKEAGQLYADITGNSNNAGLVTRVSDSLQRSFSAINPGSPLILTK